MSSRLLDAAEVMDREDDPFMDRLASLLRACDNDADLAPAVTSAAVELAECYLTSGQVGPPPVLIPDVGWSGFQVEDTCDADD